MFKLDLEKAEEPEIKLPTSSKKQESSRKTSTSALLITQFVWITTNCGKILKEMGIPAPMTCLQRNLYAGQEATGHGTDWFHVGKGVCQGYILSPCLLNIYAEYTMRNVGWMKHKLELRFPEKISITSDMQMTPPLRQKGKKS